MSKEEEILSLIESSIKKGNDNIISFSINLINNLRKIISNDNLANIIAQRLSKKNFYFLRHAEVEYNVLERLYKGDFSKCNVYDPGITETGINQTKLTLEKYKKEIIKFDGVFVSPLTRTIQTYLLVKNYLNKDTPIFMTDFVKEVLSYCDKNKGKKLSVLKNELKEENINFDYMTKEYWWFDLGKDKEDELEERLNFGLRLKIFILWLVFRPEKNILIISHSHVHCNLQDKGIVNAGLAKMNNKILYEKLMLLIYTKMNEKSKKK